MTTYYLADTPSHRALAGRLGVGLAQLCQPSFTLAHREIVDELAFAITDTFSAGDPATAHQLTDALQAVLAWHEDTATPDPWLYIVHIAHAGRGTQHYALTRLDYQPEKRPTP